MKRLTFIVQSEKQRLNNEEIISGAMHFDEKFRHKNMFMIKVFNAFLQFLKQFS